MSNVPREVCNWAAQSAVRDAEAACLTDDYLFQQTLRLGFVPATRTILSYFDNYGESNVEYLTAIGCYRYDGKHYCVYDLTHEDMVNQVHHDRSFFNEDLFPMLPDITTGKKPPTELRRILDERKNRSRAPTEYLLEPTFATLDDGEIDLDNVTAVKSSRNVTDADVINLDSHRRSRFRHVNMQPFVAGVPLAECVSGKPGEPENSPTKDELFENFPYASDAKDPPPPKHPLVVARNVRRIENNKMGSPTDLDAPDHVYVSCSTDYEIEDALKVIDVSTSRYADERSNKVRYKFTEALHSFAVDYRTRARKFLAHIIKRCSDIPSSSSLPPNTIYINDGYERKNTTNSISDYRVVFDPDENTLMLRSLYRPSTNKRVIATEVTKVLPELEIAFTGFDSCSLRMYRVFDAPPGCGKSHAISVICSTHVSPHLVLIISATKRNAMELATKCPRFHVMTAYLMNHHGTYDEVIFDEFYLIHPGAVCMILCISGATRMQAFGDSNQCRYVERFNSVPTPIMPFVSHCYLPVSYRMPLDITYAISIYYGDMRLQSSSSVRRSVVPKLTESEVNGDHCVIVFTQDQKSKHQGSITVHESQGLQFEYVTLIVPNYTSLTRDSSRYAIVGSTRHTKKLQFKFSEVPSNDPRSDAKCYAEEIYERAVSVTNSKLAKVYFDPGSAGKFVSSRHMWKSVSS